MEHRGEKMGSGTQAGRLVTLAQSCDQTLMVTLQTSMPSFQDFSFPPPSSFLQ